MTAAAQLNELLKKSDFLNSWMNAHRAATAETFAVLVEVVARDNPTMQETLAEAMRKADAGSGRPSIDGERRLLMQMVRERLAQPSHQGKTPAARTDQDQAQRG